MFCKVVLLSLKFKYFPVSHEFESGQSKYIIHLEYIYRRNVKSTKHCCQNIANFRILYQYLIINS